MNKNKKEADKVQDLTRFPKVPPEEKIYSGRLQREYGLLAFALDRILFCMDGDLSIFKSLRDIGRWCPSGDLASFLDAALAEGYTREDVIVAANTVRLKRMEEANV